MIERPAGPHSLTALILAIFRVNGRLVAAGDQLVAPLKLTSARWQVLGAVAAAQEPQSVAGLARSMGVTRQASQRIVNDLAHQGVVAFQANPRHRRAHLVVFTDEGRVLFEQAMALQRPWVAALGAGLSEDQLATCRATLEILCDRLSGPDIGDDRAA